MSCSVLQPWVEEMPIKMQSTLILGLRGFDGHETSHVKRIAKWMRGITFKPGRIDNLHQFMGQPPERIKEKDATYNELDFVTRHYYSHLTHALEVIGYRHPVTEVAALGFGLYWDLCHIFHMEYETIDAFERRLRDVEWPGGQPNDYAEACAKVGMNPMKPISK
jgi:hypothetical protein